MRWLGACCKIGCFFVLVLLLVLDIEDGINV
jgi:hypothetical protein